MKSKYRLRKWRIITVLIIIILPFILLIINIKKDISTENKIPAVNVQTTTSTICTTMQITITTVTTIPHIDMPVCKAAAFYSADEKQLIYSDNIETQVAPASLTKLLTASVALYYLRSDKVFTVGSEQWLVEPYSSLCCIEAGNTMTLKDFITGMLMASGNDAAYTIAVSTAKSLNENIQDDTEAVQYFCSLMNDFADSIGMNSSNFVNPDGWDDYNQYTTVSDLLILAEYALSVPEIKEIVSTFQKQIVSVSGEVFEWTNSNLLLDPYSEYYCENAIGMKTGTTLNAGNCLIAVFIKNNKTYISAVAGCNSDADRYELTLKLLSGCT